ncbi:MAG: putative Zn-dependent protease [Gammaproteobacteria bacterium]|jgi:predicted Zn-dependent protease
MFAAAMLCTQVASAQVNLPDFGDSSSAVFSSAAERELGKAFMAEIRQTMTIVDDPEIDDYIQSLGYKLVSSTDQQDLRFTFFVVQDNAINAFAAPGGWVGVFTGLLMATENESELASVMAHEISHVTQRHIARSVELSEKSSIATLAGILAAIAIGTQSTEAGSAALAAVLGTRAQSQIDFIRANEHEADRVGIALLDSGGFDPASMASFFEKLQTASRYYQRPPEFLSTHPVTTTRISESRSRAQQLGVRQHEDSRRYRMVRAKVRVLMSNDVPRLVKEFESEIERNAPRPLPGARYGLALAKQKMNELKAARTDLEALGRDYPDEIALRIALARVMVQDRDEHAALAMLDADWKLRPDNRMIVTTYADALLVSNDSKGALKVIDEYARSKDLDAVLLKLKASALQNLNRTAESQFFLAEHYYMSGALDLAIHQLRLAAKQPSNDFYNSSRIEARLQRLKDEQAARMRKR